MGIAAAVVMTHERADVGKKTGVGSGVTRATHVVELAVAADHCWSRVLYYGAGLISRDRGDLVPAVSSR